MQLAGCVNDEGVLLDNVVRTAKDETGGQRIQTKNYVTKQGHLLEEREIPDFLVHHEDDEENFTNTKKAQTTKAGSLVRNSID